MPDEAESRAGGGSVLPKWENLRDGSGSTYGRRLYVPAYRGWLHQAYLPGPQPLGSAQTFVPDFAAWAPPNGSSDLSQVMALLNTINQGVLHIMASLADITAAVAAQTTVEEGVVTLLQQLSADLSAAMANNDPVAMQAAVDAITANTKTLADAVAANTPTAPTPIP